MLLEPDVTTSTAEHKGSDTIYALSSGPPPAGIAVIRASGPNVREGLARLLGSLPEPRRASLRNIRHPSSGEPIDRGLVIYFAGPASFTGEDCFELLLHGGRAVVAAALDALAVLAGFRPAERGEFSRRAFVAGRMDLTEAEGIADLVAAETEAQRRAAFEEARGSNRMRYEAWADGLVRARALVEAELDFSDEEGVDGAWAVEGRDLANAIAEEMRAALDAYARARLLREGLTIVLAGPVNAGKSTLLNAIAGRDVAITSSEPGTTRDLLEVAVDLAGRRATLVDSAGMRETESVVEREGVRRARTRIADAQIVLWLSERGRDAPGEAAAAASTVWRVATKADLATADDLIRLRNDGWLPLSAKAGDGMADLIARLGQWATDAAGSEPSVVNRERHRVAVIEALGHIDVAIKGTAEEVVAEELRLATEALGRITGRIDSERVLDVVFGEFCIGK